MDASINFPARNIIPAARGRINTSMEEVITFVTTFNTESKVPAFAACGTTKNSATSGSIKSAVFLLINLFMFYWTVKLSVWTFSMLPDELETAVSKV